MNYRDDYLDYSYETDETRHGVRRMRERQGLSRRAVNRTIFNAYYEGIDYRDVSGQLYCFMRQLIRTETGVDTVRVYNRFVYLFAGRRLITTYPLPYGYVACADRAQQRKLDMLKAA